MSGISVDNYKILQTGAKNQSIAIKESSNRMMGSEVGAKKNKNGIGSYFFFHTHIIYS